MKVLQLIFLLVVSVLSAIGQTNGSPAPWESKPIDQWNKQDVETILTRSAWSQFIEGQDVSYEKDLQFVAPVSVGYTLRSAVVIRYAMIRQAQLAENYDAMDAKAKAAFNQKYKTTLECPACEKFYVVAINGNSQLLATANLVNGRSGNIYLSNEKGEKRTLAKFVPRSVGALESVFFFSRFDENKRALITAGNKTLTFNFEYRSGDGGVIKLIERIPIKVSEITRDGNVIF